MMSPSSFPEADSLELALNVKEAPSSAVTPMLVEWVWKNTSDNHVVFFASPPRAFKLDGVIVPVFQERSDPEASSIYRLAPGEQCSVLAKILISPDFHSEITGIGTLKLICCEERYTKPGDAPEPLDDGNFNIDPHSYHTSEVELPINREGIDWLLTDYGALSYFFSYSGNIYSTTKGRPLPTLVEQADIADARAVTCDILLSGSKMFNPFGQARKAPKGALQGLSDVFYRNGDQIMTSYGNAKITDPDSFIVLDKGLPALHGGGNRGYRCGYGRDGTAAYFFCQSTSTAKANMVRACKSPESLESLGHGFARDDSNVYLNGKRIGGAHSQTFIKLNAYFSRDRHGIRFCEELLEEVDPESFEILPDPLGQYDDSSLTHSCWGRDKVGIVERYGRSTEEDYSAYLAKTW